MITKNSNEKRGCNQAARDDGSRSIDTYRIFDSCRQQDCLEDLMILLPDEGQQMVDRAATVRIKSVQVPWAQIETEETPFHRGFYQVNLRYYFHCVLECSNGIGTGQETAGIAVYDRSMMLYGGSSHISSFSTDLAPGRGFMRSNSNPHIVLDVAEPVPLRLTTLDYDRRGNFGTCFCDCEGVPTEIAESLPGRIAEAGPGNKILFVSIGLFSTIRIERATQIIVPACDSSIPSDCGEYHFDDTDPCVLFRSMEFPVTEFYPDATPDTRSEPVLPLENTQNKSDLD